MTRREAIVATFSIVGRDAQTGDLGVAVQSKFLGVGSVVPWAKAAVGAIATQSYANTSYGPRGLALLADGATPETTLTELTRTDPQAAERQVGIVDAQGRAATFTGSGCYAWAGGRTGPDFAAQGNILVNSETVGDMADTFAQHPEMPLWDRLLAALAAAQKAGGDRRGQQSAALLVVRAEGGYGGFNDRFIDLRVDDHPHPIDELRRIVNLHKLYLFKTDPADLLPLTPDIVHEVQTSLTRAGDYTGPISDTFDEATRAAMNAYVSRENLEERWPLDAGQPTQIDRVVLDYLRTH
ncbi:MAG: DUF1028 domain-containing protein [Ktedonobacterales bacterium]|nr:DUF1028 domain-containing protein [Ktedonobacterales bacterium]